MYANLVAAFIRAGLGDAKLVESGTQYPKSLQQNQLHSGVKNGQPDIVYKAQRLPN